MLMQIKDDPSLKWPEKMKGDPNKRNKNKYCCFHRDHGHDTDECYDLKQQIENLIRQGKILLEGITKMRSSRQRWKNRHDPC